MERAPERVPSLTAGRTSVLMIGNRWDLVAPAISALADRGTIHFEGPVDASQVDPGAQLLLLAPDPGLVPEAVRCSRDDGSPIPLLLCVPQHALEEDGLYEGVDDFIAVPCTAEELGKRIARLATNYRRAMGLAEERSQPSGVRLDADTYEVTVAGASVSLSWMEFQLLRFFAQNPGKVFRREEILLNVWGTDYLGGVRTVDVHVRRLRSKLGANGERGLRTVRNVGYGWEREASER